MSLAELGIVGAISGAPVGALAGITDLLVFETGAGAVLISATRGGGRVVSYDLGNAPGGAVLAQSWDINPSLTQLESTDLAILGGATPALLLAGLNASDLLGLSLDGAGTGGALGDSISFAMAGLSAADFSDIATFENSDAGIAALRGGGLASFDAEGNTAMLSFSIGLQEAPVSDLVAAQLGVRDLALASFWSENAVLLFETQPNGSVRNIGSLLAAPDAAWFSQPMAAGFAALAGQPYAIVAAAGSSSLTVLEIGDNGAMQIADHVLDTNGTRFGNASMIEIVELNGMQIVLAAGADQGVTAFLLLPGGRLHLLASIAGSLDLPLAGITEMAAHAEAGTVRIFLSTQSAPYLAELVLTLPSPGEMLSLGNGGGALAGGAGGDVLAGGAGADRLTGNAGDDILLDGAGADTLTGGAGADDFLFSPDGETDVITDFIPGEDRIDLTALGLQWDFSELEIITQSWGVELRFGDEVVQLRSAGLTAASLSEADFIGFRHITYTGEGLDLPPSLQTGSAGDDRLVGGDAPDRISGLAGRDRIEAFGGNDTIWGEDGEDMLMGGAGQDSILGGAQRDTIHGEEGDDTLFGENGDDRLYGGPGDDLLDGGTGHDMLEGGEGNDTLLGRSGNDMLRGGDGNDAIFGGISNDTLRGGAGNDTLSGGPGRDRLVGDGGDDELSGGDDRDTILGMSGDDTIHGDGGNDVIRAGDDHDIAHGGIGDDLVIGGTGRDTLYGEDGNDTLRGTGGFDTVEGGVGNDSVFGGAQADLVLGGAGDDTVSGGGGFDTLNGGTGDDELTGNFNADQFIFEDGHGNDTITDFGATNDFERIDLSAVSAITGLADLELGSATTGAATQVGADVLIDTGGGNSILLAGVNLADLDAYDFTF